MNTPIYRNFNIQHDFAALVSLMETVEQADHIGEDVTEATLRKQLTWSGQDPAPDSWVVTQPGNSSLIGFGQILKPPNDDNADFYIAVHPSSRRQGIGGQLLAHILERAYELKAQVVRVYVDVQQQAATLFVRKHGFTPVSTYTRLTALGTHVFPSPTLPQGFSTRSYDQIERVDLYTDAMNRCYEGLWGHLHSTEEENARWLAQLNHAGIFLLFALDGTIVGVFRADHNPDLTRQRGASTALIDAPGVVAAYRDSQLYLPLLLTAIHWLLPQSPVTLELESWGDAAETLALYRTVGFSVMKEEISYRRDL
jgi:mycothiol synthase